MVLTCFLLIGRKMLYCQLIQKNYFQRLACKIEGKKTPCRTSFKQKNKQSIDVSKGWINRII